MSSTESVNNQTPCCRIANFNNDVKAGTLTPNDALDDLGNLLATRGRKTDKRILEVADRIVIEDSTVSSLDRIRPLDSLSPNDSDYRSYGHKSDQSRTLAQRIIIASQLVKLAKGKPELLDKTVSKDKPLHVIFNFYFSKDYNKSKDVAKYVGHNTIALNYGKYDYGQGEGANESFKNQFEALVTANNNGTDNSIGNANQGFFSRILGWFS